MVALATACLAFCGWRLAADLGATTSFPFEGAAARWQTWLAAALVFGAFAWTVLGGGDLQTARRPSRA